MAEGRERFLRHLEDQGYANETLRQVDAQIHLAAKLLALLALKKGQCVTRRHLSLLRQRWLANPPRAKYRKHGFNRGVGMFLHRAIQWLRFLGAWKDEDIAEPFDDLISRFIQFGRVERGLKPRRPWRHIATPPREFLRWCGKRLRRDL